MEQYVANVLIVDDDVSVCKAVGRTLGMEGYSCQCAENAEDGMRLLESGEFDLLISDVMMPGISGNELLREVVDLFPFLAVIMMSGKDNRETFARCYTDKGYGYLIKPFSNNQLLVSVNNALLIRKLILENKILRQKLDR